MKANPLALDSYIRAWETWNMIGITSTQWDDLDESDRLRWIKAIDSVAPAAKEDGPNADLLQGNPSAKVTVGPALKATQGAKEDGIPEEPQFHNARGPIVGDEISKAYGHELAPAIREALRTCHSGDSPDDCPVCKPVASLQEPEGAIEEFPAADPNEFEVIWGGLRQRVVKYSVYAEALSELRKLRSQESK